MARQKDELSPAPPLEPAPEPPELEPEPLEAPPEADAPDEELPLDDAEPELEPPELEPPELDGAVTLPDEALADPVWPADAVVLVDGVLGVGGTPVVPPGTVRPGVMLVPVPPLPPPPQAAMSPADARAAMTPASARAPCLN